jgi:hypothetical protein
MALRTGSARKQSQVERRILVTTRTSCWRALEDIVEVAFFASHGRMRAIQFEGRKIMVKGGGLPARGRVTGLAILSKLPLMRIIFLMAGKTGRGRALENLINMASRAFNFGVFAFQLEGRPVVVKRGRFPTCRLVTGAAFFPKFAFVRIILQVTSGAIRRGRFEIGHGPRGGMAFFASQARVFPGQLEGDPIVVKILSERFATIMTTPAIVPVNLAVGRQKDVVDFLVAGAANRRVKVRDILAVTI